MAGSLSKDISREGNRTLGAISILCKQYSIVMNTEAPVRYNFKKKIVL